MIQYVYIIIVSLMLVACERTSSQLAASQDPYEKPGICAADAELLKSEKDVRSEDLNTRDEYITPTKKLNETEWPSLSDDLNFAGMELALSRQLKRFNRLNLNIKIRLGSDSYKLEQAKLSLLKFQALLKAYNSCTKNIRSTCSEDFNSEIKKNYNIYVPKLEKGDPRYGENKQVLFTAYYTPSLTASTVKTDEFKHAVYAAPFGSLKSAFTRVDIDFHNALDKSNLEMLYTNDLFNLYLMHVQGGGRIRLVNKARGIPPYVSYDGVNGKTWTFISKYMRANNMIADMSIQAQREYLINNPDRQEEVYASCPSYVYFKGTDQPPEGSDSVSLTDNRSIATDINYYKFKGLLAFVSTERPTETRNLRSSCRNTKFMPFSRFYLDQDTGGAIRGRGRVDLYFGEGDYAEKAAYNIARRGDLYFFMLK